MDSPVEYKVFNLQGKPVAVFPARPSEVTDKFNAQCAKLPHGSYLLKSGGGAEQTILIKK